MVFRQSQAVVTHLPPAMPANNNSLLRKSNIKKRCSSKSPSTCTVMLRKSDHPAMDDPEIWVRQYKPGEICTSSTRCAAVIRLCVKANTAIAVVLSGGFVQTSIRSAGCQPKAEVFLQKIHAGSCVFHRGSEKLYGCFSQICCKIFVDVLYF